ncbi:MAG: hypothetical protein QG564_952 [Campylobacterota bacterium]|nr:hypothetical protein [Campylobacterota bacterium]
MRLMHYKIDSIKTGNYNPCFFMIKYYFFNISDKLVYIKDNKWVSSQSIMMVQEWR